MFPRGELRENFIQHNFWRDYHFLPLPIIIFPSNTRICWLRRNESQRRVLYICLIPIHFVGQENDVRSDGYGEMEARRDGFTGYRVNAPWMNDESWCSGSNSKKTIIRSIPYPNPPIPENPPTNSNRIWTDITESSIGPEFLVHILLK